MEDTKKFDVIIIGGSYAGLSAAMALGRALKSVLIIDGGKPCNRQTPHSHNFITHDGKKPKQIADEAMEQVLKYDTIQLYNGIALSAKETEKGFEVYTNEASFTARKLLFTSGVVDEMPTITGFAECWGISVLHCPYCHGYEVKNENIGIIANGDIAYEFCRLINNWNKSITLFTNGKSTLTLTQSNKLLNNKIQINENPITEFLHQNGQIQKVILADESEHVVKAIYARPSIKQHCEIPMQLGCALTEQGYLQVDEFQKTSISGVFAAGDNTTPARAVSIAVAAGTKAGISISKELIEEDFE